MKEMNEINEMTKTAIDLQRELFIAQLEESGTCTSPGYLFPENFNYFHDKGYKISITISKADDKPVAADEAPAKPSRNPLLNRGSYCKW